MIRISDFDNHLREGRRMPRLLVGDECDGIRFKYLAKPPSRDAPTFSRRDPLDIKWKIIKSNTKRQKPGLFPSKFFLFQSPVP